MLGFLRCKGFRSQFRFSGIYLVVKLRVRSEYLGLVYDGVYGLAIMVVLVVFFWLGVQSVLRVRSRGFIGFSLGVRQ